MKFLEGKNYEIKLKSRYKFAAIKMFLFFPMVSCYLIIFIALS